MPMKGRTIFVVLVCVAAGTAFAQQKAAVDDAKVDVAVRAAFPKASADWLPRLKGDETMQVCSDLRMLHLGNSPAQLQRERARQSNIRRTAS